MPKIFRPLVPSQLLGSGGSREGRGQGGACKTKGGSTLYQNAQCLQIDAIYAVASRMQL